MLLSQLLGCLGFVQSRSHSRNLFELPHRVELTSLVKLGYCPRLFLAIARNELVATVVKTPNYPLRW